MVGDLEDGAAFTDRALTLNPNLVWAWLFSAWIKLMLGEPEVAIERFARAMRLSPSDPQIYTARNGTAVAHFIAGRYSEALSWAKSSIRENSANILPNSDLCVAAASAALSGQLVEAQDAVASLRQLEPTLRISGLTHLPGLGRNFAKLAEGLRKAGLPE